MTGGFYAAVRSAATPVAALLTLGSPPSHPTPGPAQVSVRLSEWKVELSEASVPAGTVRFTITNAGSIPHAFEVEGRGIERKTALIQPGSTGTLTVALRAGSYEVYCPVGGDSHKKLGMETHLTAGSGDGMGHETGAMHSMGRESDEYSRSGASRPIHQIRVSGGGPVIQILPGPFPFPDSARPVIADFGPERPALEAQMKNGPYSDNVARISGTFTIRAWDLGATRDSVAGVSEFTTRDGTRWKLVMDRVQTHDVPHHPRFGGVIMGLYYHGNTEVHNPLVPTINSRVALWSVAHLYRNGTLVTDNAQAHVMLLSRTRRLSDFALQCWDCSRRPVEELQLQVTPAPGEPGFDAPGGFLFVNWEKSAGTGA